MRMLLPVSWFLMAVVWLRRKCYQTGVFVTWRASVPVIVVGNITLGGTGKTPVVLWLVEFLKSQGFHPGIISRGYGGDALVTMAVISSSQASIVGDEPLLLARRAACPVWIGRNRPAAARALLAANPECNVLVSDDGLQHYALARDVEIVVVDGRRRFGNGALLPAGPLRETLRRVSDADAVVINGGLADPVRQEYAMTLRGDQFHRLNADAETAMATDFKGQCLHAIAGIGDPVRFFNHLRALGLEVINHAFPDHHRFAAEDLQIDHADAILMTEKDAVKCREFAASKAWYLPVKAVISGGLGEKVLQKIKGF